MRSSGAFFIFWFLIFNLFGACILELFFFARLNKPKNAAFGCSLALCVMI
jgi:hypothetical protein